ncbi:type II toxin-antitoxin system PemK/MazF family toxin [Lichenibacterium minor]|uniref:Type II toxin-antitoxin system PemK/MazF family toxin n=1 Tax=Lichenibacterium minor TaxID=2316528 RepID=A0A4Q2U437_9HYPH|nr:type II toxin-antitoxin system PemK/MazF family toxin [Lichenibacterium minor]RYC29536.1 type II toxin-antitoxin system PemK/MazF family toxin [Lichenibacterium minor]
MNPSEADRPPHVRTRLKQAPKLRDLYWCDLPRDAQLPEFWKRRPVIVIAGDGTLSGAVQVVPCSSQPQGANRWAHQLVTTIDGVGPSWAVCDKVGTVAVSRLSIDANHSRPRRLTQEEFTAVLGLVLARLPRLQAPSLLPDLTAVAEVEPMVRLAAE